MTKPIAYLVEFGNGAKELWLASEISGPPGFGESVTPLVAQQEWQAIEIAPKDGQWFLAVSQEWDERRSAIMLRWSEPHPHLGGKQFLVDCDDDTYEHATHWMPLPEPPK